MPAIPKAESRKRLNHVYNMLVSGFSDYETREYAITEWGISRPTAYRYLQHAYKRIDQAAANHRSRQMGQQIARLNRMYAKLMTASPPDYQTARMVLKDLRDLLGLDAPKRMEARVDASLELTLRAEQTRRSLDIIEQDELMSTRALELAESLAEINPATTARVPARTHAHTRGDGGNGRDGNGNGNGDHGNGYDDEHGIAG